MVKQGMSRGQLPEVVRLKVENKKAGEKRVNGGWEGESANEETAFKKKGNQEFD